MLLIFTGQAIAMPLLDCCDTDYKLKSEMQDMDNNHDMEMSSHHHSDMANHTGETYCNYQCDVCPGTILVEEFTDYSSQLQFSHLNMLYNFTLPFSSVDNLFRPPILLT